MEEVLMRFYKGELNPEESYFPRDAEQRKQLERISIKREKLLGEMDEVTKREWMSVLDDMNASSAADMQNMYIEGMKMGA